MPNSCHLFVDELTNLVFSGQKSEVIVERATLMIRRVVESREDNPNVRVDGFRAELLDRHQTQDHERRALGHVIFADNYKVGETMGKAIGQAINGKIDRTAFRDIARAVFCEHA